MGRRKTKQTNEGDKEIVSVTLNGADPTNATNGEDAIDEENFDDPLAIQIEAEESKKGNKGSKKKTTKRASAVEKKSANKKAKQNDETENGSADEEEALDEKADKPEQDAEPEYEVEKIIDVQYDKSGGREFKIRWKGYGADGDTWESEQNLNCPDIIEKFLNKGSPKSKTKGSKKANGNKKVKKQAVAADEAVEDADPDPDGEYEVDKIIEVHHKKNGDREFLIRWKGFTSEQDTWEPEANLCCPDLIQKFMEKVKKAGTFEQREVRTARKHTERFTLTMQAKGRRASKRNDNKQRKTYFDAE